MIYLFIVSIIWSLSFSLIKGYLTGVDPYLVSFLRLLFSLVVFIPFLRFSKITSKLFFHLLIIGGLQYGLMYVAYINAYQYLKAFEIAILTIFTPFFVVLVYDFWSKKFIMLHWLKALIAVLGAGIILYSDKVTVGFWKGILLIQLSNFLFAFGQVYYKKIFKKDNFQIQRESFAVLYIGSVIVSGIFSLLYTDYHGLNLTTDQFMVLIYLGVIASGLGFFLWNYGVTRSNAGTISIMNNLKIPLGVIFAIIFLGEYVNLIQLAAGIALFLIGLFLESILRKIRINI